MSPDPRRWWILAVLCLSLFIATVDNTVLNVAIPHLVRELGLSTGQTQWVVDGYSVVFAGLLLTAGSLSDRFGRRKGLLLGLLVFGASSVGAACADSAAELVGWRMLMGLGGAFLMPGTLSVLVQVFDASERPKAIGIWSGCSGLGVAAGPVLGGLLVTHFWWGSVFLVNAPVVAVAAAGTLLLVPESRNADAGRPDLLGALLATTTMVALVRAVISAGEHGWTSRDVVVTGAVAVVAAVVFANWERRTSSPLLDPGLLRSRRFLGASSVGLLLMFALAGSTFILTQYLQLVLGYGPLEAGLRTLPIALAIAGTAPLSTHLSRLLGDGATVGIGLASVAGGLVALGTFAASDSYTPVLVGGMLVGAGLGTAVAPASAALMSSVPHQQAGLGSALNDTLQELGAAFGVAVLGAVLAAAYRAHLPEVAPVTARRSLADAVGAGDSRLADTARSAFDSAMERGLLVAAVCALVGAVVGWRSLGTTVAPASVPEAALPDTA